MDLLLKYKLDPDQQVNSKVFDEDIDEDIEYEERPEIENVEIQEQSHKLQLLHYLKKLVNSLKSEIRQEYGGRCLEKPKYIKLTVKNGANAFRTLTYISLGTIFQCQCKDRISQMKTCLELMGWNSFSPQFNLLLFKYYTYRVLFPERPNNVAGLLVREPKSMIPGSWSAFWGAKSEYEEPSFKLESDGKEILARFWILHYKNLAQGFIPGGTSLEYSLLEIRVKITDPSISNVLVLKSVPCPRNENFKAHGGCLVM